MRPARHLMISLFWLAFLPALSFTHPLTFTETTVVIRSDNTFQADLIVARDALALGAPPDTDDATLVATLNSLASDEFDASLNQVRRLFERRVRLRFDGVPVHFRV